MAKQWLVEACRGGEPHWDQRLTVGAATEAQMKVLLSRLASKYLSHREIIAASISERADGHSTMLEVRKDGSDALAIRGPGFSFAARLVPAGELRVVREETADQSVVMH